MNKTVGAVISALVIIFCIVIALFCTVRIPAGYVGVIYNMNGGVAETTLSQGFHLVKGFAKPFDHDPFNEWIGKCVAACKAMGEPIPSFITHKNTKQDAA